MPEFPYMLKSGPDLGHPGGPEGRLSAPARQSSRLSELPTALPFPAADDALDIRRRYLRVLGARADLLARTAGRNLTRDERRLLNHYEGVLADLEPEKSQP